MFHGVGGMWMSWGGFLLATTTHTKRLCHPSMLLSKREEIFLGFGVIFRHSGTVDANQAFFEGGNFIPPSINVEAFPVYSVAADANQAYDGRSFCFSINLL